MIEQPALHLGPWQVLDILVVAAILYQLYRLTRGTAAIRIFLGVLAVYLVYQIVDALQMRMLAEILGQFIGVGVIALLIVFQQELRQFLLLIGNRQMLSGMPTWLQRLLGRSPASESGDHGWEALSEGLEECRKRGLGALVVLSRNADPRTVATDMRDVDARLTPAMVVALFEKASPLHDGAACISRGRIEWAGGILPVTGRIDLPAQYGTRHRAALGISEQTDAIALVLSEESGSYSIARGGRLTARIEPAKLVDRIAEAMAAV